MKTIIKTLNIENAKLNVITAGRRIPLAKFTGKIEIIEEQSYEVLLKNKQNSNGGRPTKDHIIKLDTAKEMAMLERNNKGKQVRRYFIEIEKKYKINLSSKSLPQGKELLALAVLEALNTVNQRAF